MVFGEVWQCCTEFAGTCTRTTNAWSWPATRRRSWTAGRHLCSKLESTLRKSLLVLWPLMHPSLDRSCTCLLLTFELYALTVFVTLNLGRNPVSLSSCSPFSFPCQNEKVPHPFHLALSLALQHRILGPWCHTNMCVCVCVCSSLFLISSS